MEERGEDEFLLFERLLLLLRNILHVPASPEDEKVHKFSFYYYLHIFQYYPVKVYVRLK